MSNKRWTMVSIFLAGGIVVGTSTFVVMYYQYKKEVSECINIVVPKDAHEPTVVELTAINDQILLGLLMPENLMSSNEKNNIETASDALRQPHTLEYFSTKLLMGRHLTIFRLVPNVTPPDLILAKR